MLQIWLLYDFYFFVCAYIVAELNWTELAYGLVFDELTNGPGQAVMHYSRHRLTAAVAYVTSRTYASTND